MTMIVAAHLGDYLLLAADNRSMRIEPLTGDMQVASDANIKIQRWAGGAVAGSGEVLLMDRIAERFARFKSGVGLFELLLMIGEEIVRRLEEQEVPSLLLRRGIVFFTCHDGNTLNLYKVELEQYFNLRAGEGFMARSETVEPQAVQISCFYADHSAEGLWAFYQTLKPASAFSCELEFVNYYMMQLEQVYGDHCQRDPCVTPSFDLYLQCCKTGKHFFVHVLNSGIGAIPAQINDWEKMGLWKKTVANIQEIPVKSQD